MNSPIRVALLGPTEVRVGNEMVPIAGTKLQSVLALLALAAPHPVPDGRLVEELWGDAQPANAANALQALVSHLRRVLGPGVIVRQGYGYALAIDPDQVDAIRIERLVRQGREESARGEHAAAVQRFRAALDLVRGEPFADVIDRWFARDAAARLEEIALVGTRGSDRQRTGDGAPHRGAEHPVGAGRRAPAPRTLPGATDRRPLPLRASGGRARGLSNGPRLPPRRARSRSRARAARLGALGARPGPGARRTDLARVPVARASVAPARPDVVRRS